MAFGENLFTRTEALMIEVIDGIDIYDLRDRVNRFFTGLSYDDIVDIKFMSNTQAIITFVNRGYI